MVKSCSVFGCGNESYAGCNISFHSFPKNDEMKNIWKRNLNKTRDIKKYSCVCSRHFEDSAFVFKNGRRLLKPDAVPTMAAWTAKKLQQTNPSLRCISSILILEKDNHQPSTIQPSNEDNDVDVDLVKSEVDDDEDDLDKPEEVDVQALVSDLRTQAMSSTYKINQLTRRLNLAQQKNEEHAKIIKTLRKHNSDKDKKILTLLRRIDRLKMMLNKSNIDNQTVIIQNRLLS